MIVFQKCSRKPLITRIITWKKVRYFPITFICAYFCGGRCRLGAFIVVSFFSASKRRLWTFRLTLLKLLWYAFLIFGCYFLYILFHIFLLFLYGARYMTTIIITSFIIANIPLLYYFPLFSFPFLCLQMAVVVAHHTIKVRHCLIDNTSIIC